MRAFRQKSLLLVQIILILLLSMAAIGIISYIDKNTGNNRASEWSASPEATDAPLPAASSTPASTPEPTPLKASLIFTGDSVLHEAFQKSGRIEDEDRYDYKPVFEAIKPYIEPADYSIISFESAATNDRNDYSSYPLFNCPPEIFDAFKFGGLDMVNNSNNHQLDRKIKGMLETRENIRKAGLEAIGAYDGEEPRYIIKDLNGIKVGIMAYTYSCNLQENALTKEQRAKHIALIDEVRMEKEITELEAKADITVVAMHWGTEYTQKPTDYQIKLAHSMIEWGADAIMGSHPHVVQPSELVEVDGEAKYIIYSMGNFISNQRRGATGNPKTHKELCEDSMLVNLEFTKDQNTNKTVISKVDHIPTWLWRYPQGEGFQFRIIPVPEKGYYKNGEYPEDALALAYESYDRTMKLVKDYTRD